MGATTLPCTESAQKSSRYGLEPRKELWHNPRCCTPEGSIFFVWDPRISTYGASSWVWLRGNFFLCKRILNWFYVSVHVHLSRNKSAHQKDKFWHIVLYTGWMALCNWVALSTLKWKVCSIIRTGFHSLLEFPAFQLSFPGREHPVLVASDFQMW